MTQFIQTHCGVFTAAVKVAGARSLATSADISTNAPVHKGVSFPVHETPSSLQGATNSGYLPYEHFLSSRRIYFNKKTFVCDPASTQTSSPEEPNLWQLWPARQHTGKELQRNWYHFKPQINQIVIITGNMVRPIVPFEICLPPSIANTASRTTVTTTFSKELKVDKCTLDIMLAGGNGIIESFEEFIARVKSVARVQTELLESYYFENEQGMPISLLKVSSTKNEDLEKASILIMAEMDLHCNKMYFKIDVPKNAHSHIIGKGGSRIKQLARETNCQIHIPARNEPNNVFLSGTCFASIENARKKIRNSVPVNIRFSAIVESSKYKLIDTFSPKVKEIKRMYHVGVVISNASSHLKYTQVTINVKGSFWQSDDIKSAACKLYNLVTGKDMFKDRKIVFISDIDISPSHHRFVKDKDDCNINNIENCHNFVVNFPKDPNVEKVVVQSTKIISTIFGWQELMSYLPIIIYFDVTFNITQHNKELARIEKAKNVFIYTCKKLSGHVYTVMVKTHERNSQCLKEVRQDILNINPKICSSGTGSTYQQRSANREIRFNGIAKSVIPRNIGSIAPQEISSSSSGNNNNNFNFKFNLNLTNNSVSGVDSNISSTLDPLAKFSNLLLPHSYHHLQKQSPSAQVDYSFSSRFNYQDFGASAIINLLHQDSDFFKDSLSSTTPSAAPGNLLSSHGLQQLQKQNPLPQFDYSFSSRFKY